MYYICELYDDNCICMEYIIFVITKIFSIFNIQTNTTFFNLVTFDSKTVRPSCIFLNRLCL